MLVSAAELESDALVLDTTGASVRSGYSNSEKDGLDVKLRRRDDRAAASTSRRVVMTIDVRCISV